MSSRARDSLPVLPRSTPKLLAALGCIMIAAVIWSLATQNRDLKTETRALKAELSKARPNPESLAVGDQLTDVSLIGSGGEEANLHRLIESGGVVAFLTTTCPWCERSLAPWHEISAELEAVGIPFFGISLDSKIETRHYTEEHSIAWNMWTLSGPQERARLKITSVPQTIIANDSAAVLKLWRGALSAADAESITAEAIHQLSPTYAKPVGGMASQWEVENAFVR